MLLWCSTAGFLYSKHNDVEKDKTIILCKEVIHRRTMLFYTASKSIHTWWIFTWQILFLNGSVKKPHHKQNPNLYFRIQWSSILQERRCHLGEMIPNISRKSIYFKGNFRVNHPIGFMQGERISSESPVKCQILYVVLKTKMLTNLTSA